MSELLGWYIGDIGVDDDGWVNPEEDDPNLFKADEKITITKRVVLTAIWKKK